MRPIPRHGDEERHAPSCARIHSRTRIEGLSIVVWIVIGCLGLAACGKRQPPTTDQSGTPKPAGISVENLAASPAANPTPSPAAAEPSNPAPEQPGANPAVPASAP